MNTSQIIKDRMAQIDALDLDLLRDLFSYEDGHLVRNKTVHYNATAGSVCGTLDRSNGYLKVNFAGRVRYVHRLIWALSRNDQPPSMIDHRDGNRTNNRIANLRACDGAQNQMNRKPRGLLKGVTFNKNAGKFMAQIQERGVHEYLGLFPSAIDAARAYDAACIARFGDFARPNFKGDAL